VDPRQTPFLNVPFLYVRTLGGLALFTWLATNLARSRCARPVPAGSRT
jgi:hypothetical protein